jgi:16S rRNA (guanine527-N7)-methyltransferase
MSPASRLEAGLATLGLDLPADTQSSLLAYVALLQKWNRTYNLTAVRDAGEMVTQHLLDSLSLLAAVQESDLAGRRWADVGSGAGLPGIPLALVRRDVHMVLIEAVEKKTAFQRQAKIELGLENLTVMGARVEDVPGGQVDAVVSRAFAELADFVRLAGHLVAENGRLYAMKGRMPEEEIAALPPGWAMVNCVKLSVPGTDADRHLIALERV